MSTRSLTYFYDCKIGGGKKPFSCMYAQYEGKFLGQQYCIQLADFLMSSTLANGLPAVDNVNKIFNGMGCLAAQVVAHFKKCPGAFYLVATDLEKCGQEYEYHIFSNGLEVIKNTGRILFLGSWIKFCAKVMGDEKIIRQLQDQISELKEEIENMRKFFLLDKNNEGSKNDSI